MSSDYPPPGYQPGTYQPRTPYLPQVEKKYKALRLISVIYKVLAFVVGGLAVLGGLFILVSGLAGSSGSGNFSSGLGPAALFSGVFGFFFLVMYGAVLFVALYGAGEFILVFLAIEENTRVTNMTLAAR